MVSNFRVVVILRVPFARTVLRRSAPGDKERAAALLAAALSQFRAIGMVGWITRAEALLRESCY